MLYGRNGSCCSTCTTSIISQDRKGRDGTGLANMSVLKQCSGVRMEAKQRDLATDEKVYDYYQVQ